MRRLTISPRIRADHGLVAALVAAGFAGSDSHDVEVHLKAAAATVTRWLVACHAPGGSGRPVNYRAGEQAGHCARTRGQALALAGDPQAHHRPEQLVVQRRYPYSGRAYQHLPEVARVTVRVRYLVTLRMPADPQKAAEPYPRISRYERYKTAPPITIRTWQEDLFHLAAHEARHVHQFRRSLPCSEIDAEHWALRIVRRCPPGRTRASRSGGCGPHEPALTRYRSHRTCWHASKWEVSAVTGRFRSSSRRCPRCPTCLRSVMFARSD
jgi:hypothetical protein